MSKYLVLALVGLLAFTVACGNGSGSGSSSGTGSSIGCAGTTPTGAASNVQPIIVDGGAQGNYADAAFANVTICVPGTSTCQTIPHMLVDTGSMGVRVLASATDVNNNALALPLTQQMSGGKPVVECAQFLSFVTWGPVETADVKISGETAAGVPIQVIDSTAFPNIPSACSSAGTPAETLTGLGSNGILGVGAFPDDCGLGCTLTGSQNPGLYYTCSPATSCQVAAVTALQLVPNPVAKFSQDNNGTVVELPAIPSAGAVTVSGSLVFGIGTQSNNGLNGASVLTVDPSTGDFSTLYKGTSYGGSFIDSGSNGLFFLTSSITGIPLCTGSKDASDFYCPTSTQTLSATNQGLNGVTKATTFSVANLNTLNGAFNAFDNLAGPNNPPPGSSSSSSSFDWGLPFFFGCNVFTAIDGKNTPGGAGPYFAY